MKRMGLAVLMATLTPTAFAHGRYIEVWNPPEARASAPHKIAGSHKTAFHRHGGTHAARIHARRIPASAPIVAPTTAPASSPKLMANQHRTQDIAPAPATAPATAPDMTDIPRQITPEGNVLRVSSRPKARLRRSPANGVTLVSRL
ncbi:MAG: hypothetical protein CPDRYMAC_6402 [uncultured Paraburkholderia sp.]|nr:MAG: hypothetical protein CPDRYDRY_6332 [uncultured Paraburkholderia sp.]CAH2944371.1 MAG: hypothetical protein CPDRYMAC_6402 [uncultured Paraburkholderia sp.]